MSRAWLPGLVIGAHCTLISGCVLLAPRNDFRKQKERETVGIQRKEEVPAGKELQRKRTKVAQRARASDELSPYHPEKPPAPARETEKPPLPPGGEISKEKPSVAITSVEPEPQEPPAGSRPPALPIEPLKREPEPALLTAMRHYLNQEPAEAMEALKKHSPSTQELLSLWLPLAVRSTEKELGQMEARELAATLEQLRQLTRLLQSKAALELKKMCFCQSIQGYGSYVPLKANPSFETGSEGRPGELARVYVEVSNFTNLPRGNFYETTFAIRFEIRDSKGNVQWSKEKQVGPEQARSSRQDCFLNCWFHIPAKLAVADYYTLHLEVRDITLSTKGGKVPDHRIARSSLDFQVKAHGQIRGR